MYHEGRFGRVEDDQFEQVAGLVRVCGEVTRRVVIELHPADQMLECVGDVLVGHPMPSGSSMDLHTQ
ncbi:MAG TPA: hypothetical protein VF954_04260 [Acidimicrobiales bacterium]